MLASVSMREIFAPLTSFSDLIQRQAWMVEEKLHVALSAAEIKCCVRFRRQKDSFSQNRHQLIKKSRFKHGLM
jgi:hypothetical protein